MTKYSKEITEEICKYIEAGNTQHDAATLVDISDETFHQWKNNRPEFAEALKKATTKSKNRNIQIIQRAAITTWQAAAWWLERRFRDEYALKQFHDLSGNLNVDLSSSIKKEREKRGIDSKQKG